MGIARQIFPSTAADTVGVFTQDFKQVFPLARPIKAVVKEEAKLMEHPLETGATTTDHRIIRPVEIEISLIIDSQAYLGIYEQIKQLYRNATLLVVQTKSGVYANQLIAALPHEENPDTFDVLTMAISFKEVQFASTKSVAANNVKTVKNARNSDTVDRGTQQASAATAPQESAASQAFRGIKNGLSSTFRSFR